MNYDQNDCLQFSFITSLFSDICRHTKNKSWRRCRLYFRGRMQCWWIFDFETDYICHSRCFGIRGDHGKSAFKLAVKLSVELGYVFRSLRL
jgi:hypothetical protein